eukprot:CAMPEP_0202970630 /NCGR_PEP_ID=MMETSP1396-20130829/18749_1 /ASSEMBLY_ACC=CAM_ASM_000872 /TAXON_ID= /ORGANISM="Pseudokeronopsis sp., Strain Brazil" /LENGTH=106 /DNA_ID=CAMNT_0049699273 /DNA_START=58 /DNA_END=378 /DNA_ORIENTATION=+
MFSRLNMKSHELKGDIKRIKDELDALEDAKQLIEESFGEGLKLFIGESLIDVDEDQANEFYERVVEEKQAELEGFKDKLDEIEDTMKNLKSYLYARFGSAINLEEE